MTSLRQRLRRVPAPVVDAGLAVVLAVAIAIGIRAAPPWLTVLFMFSGFLAVFVGPLAAVDVLFNLGRGSTSGGRPR